MERLTTTSNDGGVALTFDLDVTCYKSEMLKILKMAEKLKTYEDAEEQGLLLRLPLKMGDEAWAIRNYKGTIYAQKGFVNEMFFTNEMKLTIVVKNIGRGEFGKTVFLTKEEAEQSLIK